jgi:hypothetical protein
MYRLLGLLVILLVSLPVWGQGVSEGTTAYVNVLGKIPVWPELQHAVAAKPSANLKCGERVFVLTVPGNQDYDPVKIRTKKGKVGWIHPGYLSLSSMPACAVAKSARPKVTGESIAAFGRAFSLGMQTNNVCSQHGGAKSWRSVTVHINQDGIGQVYSSTGTYLGTVNVSSTGTATARIATCWDGTELTF